MLTPMDPVYIGIEINERTDELVKLDTTLVQPPNSQPHSCVKSTGKGIVNAWVKSMAKASRHTHSLKSGEHSRSEGWARGIKLRAPNGLQS